jgi:hypothetical protein
VKREAALKAAFFKDLKRQAPSFYVLQYSTAGAPDREIVGNGVTTRWEFKHACPTFTSHENQELFCTRLAVAGHCRYVFWWESSNGTGRCTMIVHPLKVLKRIGHQLEAEARTDGFDHAWLVEQVKRAHGGW